MSKILFYLSISVLFYTYFGYPLLMFILAGIKKEKPILKANISPYVSLVIAAYNEEKNINAKINEVLNLDYPLEKMEVFVISDASSDKTDEIVKGFSDDRVRFYRLQERSGKIAAYRKVLPLLKGEIIVFCDATGILDVNAITNLVSNFNDKTVGCVGGLLSFVNHNGVFVGDGESKYWKYEKKIKALESSLYSLSSVSGTLYAIRKNLFPCSIKDDLADDLVVPIEVIKKGYRTILEPKAICREFTTISVKQEIAKRVRITIQNIRGLIDKAEILNPFKYGLYSFIIISHKLFRLLVPAFLLMLFITNLILADDSWFYSAIFAAQIMFYLLGLSGYLLKKKVKAKIVNSVFYFCLSNLAILLGIIGFFRGKKIVTWQTIRLNV